ncbi:hypothetical protein [uncultured Pseudoxanthomonas sp.]|uniref:hypothetical protein n=1 Tax=uncultured Pseudoxanthomonas sp. TaxID=281701 RepID=UPI00262943AF|nr:hypothetical protein [uncultured Pseudoxanthomonas sp.]
MRTRTRLALWLGMMASVVAASPTIAQEGPPPEIPGRVESDPQLAAASEAWHGAWRANVEAQLRTIAARGTPRDLLVAGWLWPIENDDARRQESRSFWRREARDWIQAAYDASTGDDPLVDWALLNACPKNDARCDRAQLLQRLMAADPGNAEVLLAAYHDAAERRDGNATERYWQAAANATHYRGHVNDVGLLMASTLRQVPAPPLDPALAAAMGEDFGIGRAATPQDLADMAVMGINAAIAMPSLSPVTQRCRTQVEALPLQARSACKRIYALMADDASILITRAVALPQLVQWADTDVERAAARERLRRFAWVYENTMLLYQRPATARQLPADYVDVFLRDGELAAMRRQLQANGLAGDPPVGWLPDRPDYRALLTDGPPSAP